MDITVYPYKVIVKFYDIIHIKNQHSARHIKLNKSAIINYYFSHTEGQRKDSAHRLRNQLLEDRNFLDSICVLGTSWVYLWQDIS